MKVECINIPSPWIWGLEAATVTIGLLAIVALVAYVRWCYLAE